MNDHIDYAVLKESASILKKKFPAIVDIYIEDAQNYVTGILQGIEENDAHMTAQNAHPLKSSSDGMGVIKVHTLAKSVEIEAKSAAENGASISHMKQAAEDIKAALEQAVPLLREYTKGTSA